MEKGFTLLELIVVVIVIGILAMVALPRFIRVAERARCAEGKLILGAIRSAQFRYYTEHGRYTNNSDDLDVNFSTLRYFEGLEAYNGTPGVDNMLGFIRRSGSYVLRIAVNGTISCAELSLPDYTCTDAGF